MMNTKMTAPHGTLMYTDEVREMIAAKDTEIARLKSMELCLNHYATMAGDRMRRNDGACAICIRDERIAELEAALRDAHRFVRAYCGPGAAEELAITELLERAK